MPLSTGVDSLTKGESPYVSTPAHELTISSTQLTETGHAYDNPGTSLPITKGEPFAVCSRSGPSRKLTLRHSHFTPIDHHILESQIFMDDKTLNGW
jgi:hypothetical protein